MLSKGKRLSIFAGLGLATTIFFFKYPLHSKPHNNNNNDKNNNNSKRKKVAVIGAGVSGIVTTKWLAEEGHEVKTFEQSDGIGGNWRYIEHGGIEHSSCYKNLTTITSSHSMSFEGLPMPKSYGIYPHHTKILKYLNYYCDENQLWNYFHLKTKVNAIRATEGGYNVTYSSNGLEQTESFDAIAVCNGHNSQPYWPSELEKELKSFTGTVIHSRSYRDPSQFKGKNVLILGGGISGQQIAFDISHQANMVAVSSRRPISISDIYTKNPTWRSVANLLGTTVNIKPALTANPFSGKEVKFSNGMTLDIDAIIICTGYQNKFTFLESNFVESIVRFPEDSKHPAHLYLYKQTFPIFPGMSEFPTVAFIGMMDVYDSSMFPVADVQAKWYAKILAEKTRLPSLSQMSNEMDVWVNSINLHYHPMTITSPSLFRDDVHKLIEENKT